jgi:hypothetical protein
MKFILLLLLLVFACAAAMLLITRLNRIAAQLGALKRDAARKDDELARRVADFNAQPNHPPPTTPPPPPPPPPQIQPHPHLIDINNWYKLKYYNNDLVVVWGWVGGFCGEVK